MRRVLWADHFDEAGITNAGLVTATKLGELLCKQTRALIKMESGRWVVAHSVVSEGRGEAEGEGDDLS